MKSLQFQPLSSAFIFAITMVTISTANAADGTHDPHVDKQSAQEYWAEFKQDSKQTWKDSKEAFKDGWIESKLETALVLNKYLNTSDIDINVDNNIATLSGEVHSDIQKELAENIALGIEGIDSVKNNLKVVAKPAATANTQSTSGKPPRRSFSQYVNDVSTTAAIKTELLASKNVEGLEINVDTYNNVVTLSGKVNSGAQKDLAQAIAAKQNDVKNVVNKLDVKS
ncbi:BON domain-containing protein [Cellvibrio mixtus]|uniref:BON domain-containing protein n=1 Tax=Cellvibrio mixtus TaxID=39650 RepID=UPI000587A44B|nr:BON domain-containing protein [Cellvibrio mixtus]